MDKRKITNVIIIGLLLITFIIFTLVFKIWSSLASTLVLSLTVITFINIIKCFNSDKYTYYNSQFDNTIIPLHHKKKVYLIISISIIALRLIAYAASYFLSRYFNIINNDFSEIFDRLWASQSIDAPHYLDIAKSWYVTEGDAKYFIVFFPFFPILIKLFQIVFQDYLISAIIVTTIASCTSGILAYELALLDFDEKTAIRFVKYIFILPAAFFYFAPMSESVFIMLCLGCIYFTRKRKYVLMAVLGILAAFTRSAGVFLMLPCAIITFLDTLYESKNKANGVFAKKLIKRWLLTVSISLGLVTYLIINYTVWHNPFQFTAFQMEHWNQSLGFFGNTIDMIWDYFTGSLSEITTGVWMTDYHLKLAFSLWLPQLVCILSSLLIMNGCSREIHPAYSAYFIAYFIFSIGATWLLSSPRYLMACFPIPLGIAAMTKTKTADIISTALCSILSIAFFIMFTSSCPIY